MALPPPYEQPPGYAHPSSDLIGDPSPPTHVPALVHPTAQDTTVAEVATPETKTRLMQEVQSLADSVLKVSNAFERIRVDLGKVDEKNHRDKDGKLFDKFQPAWIGYQKVTVVPRMSFSFLYLRFI
jgi:hypothetical protein